jgi:hypothetical protein
MPRMVEAAATMGTGSVALKTNERARCLMWSTTSSSPRMMPPMPPKVFENVETTTSFSVGKVPSSPCSSRMPRPCTPSVPVPCASSSTTHAS